MKKLNKLNVKKKNNKIYYNDIFKNVDLNYELFSNKLKETIIINNKESNTDFAFDIETNLKLELTNKGTIVAKKDNEIVYVIDKPFIKDSNDNYGEISYVLSYINNKYELKFNIDYSWLNSDEIKYPIIIDPTIIVNENSVIQDTYIYEGDTNVDRNNSDILKVGVLQDDNRDIIHRTLIKFDLPTIPTGSIVTNATLRLTSHSTDISSEIVTPKPITDVHKLTTNWEETSANWETMHDKYDARIEDSCYTYKSYENDFDEIVLRNSDFNITNLVKRWYSGEPNYGIMLKKHIEEYNNYSKADFYYSKSHNLTSVDPKPVLAISYCNQNGLEDYYSYDSQSYEDGSSYINRNNGNLTTSFALNSTLNGKYPATINLYYNTNDFILNNDYGYGKGYKLNYYQTLKEVVIDENNYIEYLDQDGTIHYFYQNEDVYEDEDGLGFTISLDDNQKYILTDSDNSKMIFEEVNSIWYLKNIVNQNGNIINIEYDLDMRIIKVTDADNKIININYEENKITISSDWTTSVLNYTNNKLTSLETKNGITSFIYNSNNLLERIVDTSLKSIKFEYYNCIPYRIYKVCKYGLNDEIGNYITYNYGYDSTTIIDNKNRINTYCFNVNGSAVSMSSLSENDKISEGYGKTNTFYTYGGKKENRLLDTTSLVRYSKNYIIDSSFENETLDFVNYNNTTNILYEGNTGGKSLKIHTSSDNGGESDLEFNVPKGETYTFSAYLKEGVCFLELHYSDVDGNTQKQSVKVPYTTDFTRYDLTIEYPENATSNLLLKILTPYKGEIIIDDLQLEKGYVANYYNLIENGDFENGLDGYTISSTSQIDGYNIPTDEIVTLESNEKALKLKSDPYVEKILQKTINISGLANDTYNLSFWYKNLGLETSYQTSMYGNYNFALINFHYTEEVDGSEPYIAKLYTNSNKWQFYSSNFTAVADYDKITITLMNLNNANEIYLTCLSLFKDLSNTAFNYDDNGNLITIYDKKNNETITYDNIGNPLTIGNVNLNWINGRLLNSYNDTNNNLIVNYKYDKDGLRIEKTINGITHNYYLDGKKIVIEKIGNDMLYYIRDINGKLVAVKYNNNLYYYELNLQDDVIGLLDNNFNKIATYEYDSWGNVISVKDSNGDAINDSTNIAIINPFRYRSYYYDEDTKLYYLNTRYYNPKWGRFINADSSINDDIFGNNLYTYCGNNSSSRTDVDGKLWFEVAMVCFGAIASAGFQAASNVAKGEKWYKNIAGAAVAGAVGTACSFIPVIGGVASAFIAAAAGAVTNEVVNYVTQKKKISKTNLIESSTKVVAETIVGGTLGAISSSVASDVVKVNYKSWFKPKKFVSIFTGKYSVKVYEQTIIDNSTNLFLNTAFEHASIINNENQEKIIELFPRPEWELEF